jgi:hypothetical protein
LQRPSKGGIGAYAMVGKQVTWRLLHMCTLHSHM